MKLNLKYEIINNHSVLLKELQIIYCIINNFERFLV